MSAQPNNTPESTGARSSGNINTPTRPFYWSVQRELWENRSIYVAPMIVAAVVHSEGKPSYYSTHYNSEQ
jgi:hypothetical protein